MKRLDATVHTFPTHGREGTIVVREHADNVCAMLYKLFDPALFTFTAEGIEGERLWVHVSSRIHLAVGLVDKMTMAAKGYLLGRGHNDLI